MFDGSNACWIPTLPLNVSRKPRLHIAKYGDGYEQRMADGINYMNTEYGVSFDARPENEIIAMDTYLSERSPHAFPFQHPVTKAMLQVFCDEWSISWNLKRSIRGGVKITYGTLSATFRVAYGEAVT